MAHRNEDYYHKAWKMLVPDTGEADTEAGEILRCGSRVIYRYYNDGDVYNHGYGRETVNPAMNYIAKCRYKPIKEIAKRLKVIAREYHFWSKEDREEYKANLEALTDALGDYAKLVLEGKQKFKVFAPTVGAD